MEMEICCILSHFIHTFQNLYHNFCHQLLSNPLPKSSMFSTIINELVRFPFYKGLHTTYFGLHNRCHVHILFCHTKFVLGEKKYIQPELPSFTLLLTKNKTKQSDLFDWNYGNINIF